MPGLLPPNISICECSANTASVVACGPKMRLRVPLQLMPIYACSVCKHFRLCGTSALVVYPQHPEYLLAPLFNTPLSSQPILGTSVAYELLINMNRVDIRPYGRVGPFSKTSKLVSVAVENIRSCEPVTEGTYSTPLYIVISKPTIRMYSYPSTQA